MSNKILVSIIIPFLNAEKFIQEAIESVLVQTYDAWELLLIDDGSTDGSTEIASRYAKKYPEKIRYFEHEAHANRGACASRNLGVSNADGEYIALLDADDVWLSHKLEQQVEILNSQLEIGMVYGATQYWHSWTGKPEDVRRDYVEELGVHTDGLFKPPELLTLSYPLGKSPAPCPSNLLIRREVVQRIGGFEEAFHGPYQLYEDQAFLTKLYLNSPVYVSSECWIKYRLHPDSCDSLVTNAGHYHKVRLFFLNWLTEYLSKQKVEDPQIWKALHRALRPYRHPALSRLLNRTRYPGRQMKETFKLIAQQTLSAPNRHWLRTRWQGGQQQHYYRPPVGWVRMGSLRRVTPIDDNFGFGRGLPIDRYYIERFLDAHAPDVKGRVLEVADSSYTRRFGGDRVAHSDVLHVTEGNPEATIVGDLACADHIPSDAFDCIILTQTLHLIYDMRAAVGTLYRILKPGGVLLATVPGISQIDRYECKDTWYWSLTTQSARRLFAEGFAEGNVEVEGHGNVLAAVAYLHGLAVAEMRAEELDYRDPAYEVLITIRAVKPEVTS